MLLGKKDFVEQQLHTQRTEVLKKTFLGVAAGPGLGAIVGAFVLLMLFISAPTGGVLLPVLVGAVCGAALLTTAAVWLFWALTLPKAYSKSLDALAAAVCEAPLGREDI